MIADFQLYLVHWIHLPFFLFSIYSINCIHIIVNNISIEMFIIVEKAYFAVSFPVVFGTREIGVPAGFASGVPQAGIYPKSSYRRAARKCRP